MARPEALLSPTQMLEGEQILAMEAADRLRRALHNSSMLSIARPQRTNIFKLVIGTVLCFN